MLKKTLILLSASLFGCASTNSNLTYPKIKNQQEYTTNIFYYYVDPIRPAQATSIVEGSFQWKEGCLYLLDRKGIYSTAMFPLYPKDNVKWDEKSKTLTSNGHIFTMGDWINTNGNYDRYVPNTGRFIEYERQGDKKCLTSNLAYIGTMDIHPL